ncbi:TPA: single-stranded DNA-binding protein [Candidatus Galligastranaerophilus gallistercoris]|nr:single-stranded DNA-binding protein [Candidatus Galligastranaerophilus gallistercoris]
MTLAKIVVTGKVVKNPEKRFTQNNLAITNLIVDINPQDETLVRVSAIGALADRAAETVQLNDTVIIDGRLQMENVKTTSGKDKKVATITASNIEKIGASADAGNLSAAQTQAKNEPVVQFSTEEIAEDLIDPDEIPF